jgi:hypothetical protein
MCWGLGYDVEMNANFALETSSSATLDAYAKAFEGSIRRRIIEAGIVS